MIIPDAKMGLRISPPIIVMYITLIGIPLFTIVSPTANASPIGQTSSTGDVADIENSSNRLVIINFDDSYDSQIDYAKPILDKYGFKATFFEICKRITESGWQDILRLQEDGMDIQAHTMTHPNLNELSDEKLDTELRKAKECFQDHGIKPTIFAYPYGNGWNNETVLGKVAEHYDLARTNSIYPLTFLNCDFWDTIDYKFAANDSSNSIPSCIREEEQKDDVIMRNGNYLQQTLGSSRYAINSWSHKHVEGPYDYSSSSCTDVCRRYDNAGMLERFVEVVNSQGNFNKDGTIRAIPVIVYHAFVPFGDISESDNPTDTTVNLFEQEMRYLRDNGFRVLTMKDIEYDKDRGTLSIKNMSLV